MRVSSGQAAFPGVDSLGQSGRKFNAGCAVRCRPLVRILAFIDNQDTSKIEMRFRLGAWPSSVSPQPVFPFSGSAKYVKTATACYSLSTPVEHSGSSALNKFFAAGTSLF